MKIKSRFSRLGSMFTDLLKQNPKPATKVVATVKPKLPWSDIKKLPEKFEPVIAPDTFIQIITAFLEEHWDEIAGFGLYDEESNTIKWAFVAGGDESERTSGSVISNSSTADAHCFIENGVPANVMWHTHPMMSTFFSLTDQNAMSEYAYDAAKLSKTGYVIFIVLDRLSWLATKIMWDDGEFTRLEGYCKLGEQTLSTSSYGRWSNYKSTATTYTSYSPVKNGAATQPQLPSISRPASLDAGYGAYGLYGNGDHFSDDYYSSMAAEDDVRVYNPNTNKWESLQEIEEAELAYGGDYYDYKPTLRPDLEDGDGPRMYNHRTGQFEPLYKDGELQVDVKNTRPYAGVYDVKKLKEMTWQELEYYGDLFLSTGVNFGDWDALHREVVALFGDEKWWKTVLDDDNYWVW